MATSPKLDASQTSSQYGNEGQQGTGERRAETDRTIDDQSEALWTVFEEMFMSCSPVRVRRSTANVVRWDVYGDSDHVVSQSTTGMVSMRIAHCLEVSSRTQ